MAKQSEKRAAKQLVTEVRNLGLIPMDELSDREKFLYSVYATARDCVTGSMQQLYTDLGMSASDFYHDMDFDLEFNKAVMSGLSDGRAGRLLQLESAIITLALGQEIEEVTTKETDDGIETTKYKKKVLPNLQALQILLERYEGSSWTVTEKVKIDDSNSPREIDYSKLTKAQLKALAYGK